MVQISIALCTYNGALFLQEQLESILRQTAQPLELCIGDDGSTDATLDILNRFAARAPFRVVVNRNRFNLGYGENFIQTAKLCAGEWIAFCDQDDVWLPKKLERCAELINQGPPDLRLVVHNAAVVDSEGNFQKFLLEGANYDWGRATTFAKHELPPAWTMYGNCMVFDRSLIRDVPTDGRAWPCFTAEPHEAHDSWIPILAAALGSVRATSDPLIHYRRHGGNTSDTLMPAGARERIAAKLRPDARYLDSRAHQLGRLSDRLAERADSAGREDFRIDLRRSAVRYDALGTAYARRAELARGASLTARMVAFRQLVGSGAYQTPDGWGFGKSAMFKDLIHSLLGSARGPAEQ